MPGRNKKSRSATRQDKYDAARAILERGLDHVSQDPETLAAYLRFRAHFRRFSARNTLMLLAQHAEARYCMGFRQWKAHGRQVRKGQRGLMIYVPRLKKLDAEEAARLGGQEGERLRSGWLIAYLFDISQTEVVPECEATALRYISPIPQLDGDDFAHLYDELGAVAASLGFAVQQEEAITQEGYCSHARQVIGIRSGLTVHSKAATLAHELAHAVAHQGCRGALSKAAKELQAEGAAYLACAALGLDTAKASLPYLKHYAGEAETLGHHLGEIDRIAWRIVEAVEQVREHAAGVKVVGRLGAAA